MLRYLSKRHDRVQAALAVWVLLVAGCSRQDQAIQQAEESKMQTDAQAATIDILGTSVHYLAAGPKEGRPVLLLHGAAFHSGTWNELGTLTFLAEHSFHAVAVDLPGYGATAANDAEPAEFLEALIDGLELERPVIVSPSMSGRFSLPYVAAHPETVGGFVPVAPVGIARFQPLPQAPFKSLILFGSEDRIVPPSSATLLEERLPNSRVVILEGASHPCYLDQPERFHQLLLEFLESAR